MIQTVSDLRQWWEKSELGQYVYAQEWDFFQQAAGSLAGRRTLLTGAFTEQSAAQMATQGALWQCATLPADVLAEETVLPWRDNVFDVVLTAHAGDFGAVFTQNSRNGKVARLAGYHADFGHVFQVFGLSLIHI